MERSTCRKPGGARPDVSQCKKLGNGTKVTKETCRGESEVSQGKFTNLDGTKMEQFVKSVEEKLRSEMNALYKGMLTHVQFLEESLRGESEASQGKLTNLDGTKMEQFANSVEDNLRSETKALYEGMGKHPWFLEKSFRSKMNDLSEGMRNHLQFLKEILRGESEAPQGKLTNLDRTKMEQLVNSVKNNLSEMNDQLEDMLKHLQFLKERFSTSVPYRGESEAPQGKLTNLDGTKMEQFVNSVEDKLSEMNDQLEDMLKHLQFLKERFRGESEAPQGKLTNLDRTKMEQLVNSVKNNLRSEMSTLYEDMGKYLQFLKERLRELPKMVSAEEFHQKEEECEKLKEQKRVLEQKLDLVLANAMRSHKFSENLNDPCRLSAVLEMYDRLRIHEWEKAKCAASVSTFPMTYEKGSTIIKAVFSICEEELSQRLERIFELLEIPVLKKTTSLFDSQQLPPGLSGEIKNHLKHLYFNYGEDFYQAKSRLAFAPDQQRFQPLVKFTAKCYKIYCLLLLQNPPIKVMWPTDGRIQTAYIEHVDKKVIESSIQIKFLWPVLTCGNQLVRKGVIYD
ncbi:uncharacterized protein LOC116838140 isoform X1 [Chelonoidis abingdonii]|uniref:uncharacterized protein LOC116838140 isoform X1 n=1 Tax=Chelonoidis abingdonii TaxID=106734 RepID=UPI003F49285E